MTTNYRNCKLTKLTKTTQMKISGVDLLAALRHDRRIAAAEGFTGVAERANAAIEFLEEALNPENTPADAWLSVSIVVTESY